MAVNARVLIDRTPLKQLLSHGLFSVAEMRTPVDRRWQNGVTWQNTCPDANSTYEQCLTANALGVAVTGVAAPPAKTATAERAIWGATPFTVKVEVDCSPPGFWDRAEEIVKTVYREAEESAVEEVFWTGTVAGTADLALPHLAADAEIAESFPGGAVIQLSAANVGPTGTGLHVVEAMGKLEAALSSCVKGVGVIHVPAELLSHLVAWRLVREEDGVYYSPAGHRVAVGTGYPGTSPAGASTADTLWMYGTGPVFLYRNAGRFLGSQAEAFNRTVDTLKVIFERTYLVGYDCCLFAVPVNTAVSTA